MCRRFSTFQNLLIVRLIIHSVKTVQYSLLMANHHFDKAPAVWVKFWNAFHLLNVLLECLGLI